MTNPFTLTFGREPTQMLSRISDKKTLVETFNADDPVNQVFLCAGIRGSGKTVFMTEVLKYFRRNDDWIVVELSPEEDVLGSLASKLYRLKELYNIFLEAKFNFSFFNLGVSIEGEPPVTDIGTVVEMMLEKIRDNGKRLLIAIDEVSNTEYVRKFTYSFQIYVRQDLPIYLIMTGLYENIRDLQDERSLTFLYRAPKIEMTPLNGLSMKNTYKKVLDVDDAMAADMSRLTKGYPFAFQLVGSLVWEHRGIDDISVIYEELDQQLGEFVYQKICTTLTSLEIRILLELSDDIPHKIKDVRDRLDMSPGTMSTYRTRLRQKGLIDTSSYGYMSMCLPRFGEYLREFYDFNLSG